MSSMDVEKTPAPDSGFETETSDCSISISNYLKRNESKTVFSFDFTGTPEIPVKEPTAPKTDRTTLIAKRKKACPTFPSYEPGEASAIKRENKPEPLNLEKISSHYVKPTAPLRRQPGTTIGIEVQDGRQPPMVYIFVPKKMNQEVI